MALAPTHGARVWALRGCQYGAILIALMALVSASFRGALTVLQDQQQLQQFWDHQVVLTLQAAATKAGALQNFVQGQSTLKTENGTLWTVGYKFHRNKLLFLKRRSLSSSLVVAVLSAGPNHEHRNLVRNTWGPNVDDHRLFFLVSGNWTLLQAEFEQHGDLFFVDQPESYRWGLTPKVMVFFDALIRQGAQFAHVLKTDDDAYVQLDAMQSWLTQQQPDYAGTCFRNMPILRQQTGPLARYYVSEQLLPNRTLYPTYSSGAGYVLSRDAVSCLSEHMALLPYLPSEDANTGRVLHEHCPTVQCTRSKRFECGKFNPNKNTSDVFLQHYVKKEFMQAYHDHVTQGLPPEPSSVIAANVTLQTAAEPNRTRLRQLSYRFHKLKLQRFNVTESSKESPTMIVGIVSATPNAERRQKIRETWGQSQAVGYRLFFLVAGEWTWGLTQEFEKHRDLFHVSHDDTFPNLSLKVLSFVHAVHQHAVPPYFLLKTDDDSMARLAKLQKHVNRHHLQDDYVGLCRDHSPIERDPTNRYYVPPHLLNGTDTFPRYAYGFGYVLSHRAVACLATRLAELPALPVEDANTGWMLQELCGGDKMACVRSDKFALGGFEAENYNRLVQHPVSMAQLEKPK